MSPRSRSHLFLLGLVFALYLVVPTWIQYPLDLFQTFIHEAGHALAALLTGGEVEYLLVEASGAGVTASRGGSRLVILCGGYLGVTAFGVLLLRLNTIPGVRIYILESLAAIVAGLTLYYGGSAFTLGLGLGAAAILALIGLRTSPQVEFLTVNFLAVYTGLGALKDLGVLWRIQNGASRVAVSGSHGVSDAEALAQVTGFPANGWVVVWVLFSLVLLGRELYRTSQLD